MLARNEFVLNLLKTTPIPGGTPITQLSLLNVLLYSHVNEILIFHSPEYFLRNTPFFIRENKKVVSNTFEIQLTI